MASSPGKKGGRQSTLAFRLINPELFIKPVGIISLSISFLFTFISDVDGGRSSSFDQPASKIVTIFNFLDALYYLSYFKFSYSCFEKGCPIKPYATMPKGIMCNSSSRSLFEALGVLATERETAQTNVFIPSLFSLVNTVNLNQSTPNSFYP